MSKVKNVLKYRFLQQAGGVHKLYLYDDVRASGTFNWETWEFDESETSAKAFRDQLSEIPDGDLIELHVNSAGGEVNEGVAIYNMIKQTTQRCPVVGYVDGMAYSIAMDIVMACDEIHMGLGTTMFLHYPWMGGISGNATQLRNYADQLDAMGDSSVQLYMARAKNLEEAELRAMMEKETMLSPNMCLKYGFCDYVDDYKAVSLEAEETEQLREQVKQLVEQTQKQAEIIEMLQKAQETPKQEEKPNLKHTLAEAAKLLRKGE